MTNQERGWGVAIDATVTRVDINPDGSGCLHLAPRDCTDGTQSTPGQNRLTFLVAPKKVHALTGKDIWGGTGDILLGSRKIADRAGYEMLVFLDDQDFNRAIQVYHWKTHPETR